MFEFIQKIPDLIKAVKDLPAQLITELKSLSGEAAGLGSAYAVTLNTVVAITAIAYTGLRAAYLVWRWRREIKGLPNAKSADQ